MAKLAGSTISDKRYSFFVVGAIGAFMGTLDSSILNVALPTISSVFELPIDRVAWVILAYTLTLVSLLIVFGAWAGRRGYFFAYKFGYVCFLIGSLLCAVSPTFSLLLLGRVIQAIGAAMFQAIGVGMVTRVFPAGERGKGIGMMTMMVALGLMTGPVVGGLILQFWSWRMIFIINIPVGLIGLWLTYRYFGSLSHEVSDREVRMVSSVALAIGFLAMMFGLSMFSNYSFTDIRVWGVGLVAVISFAGFFWLEADPRHRLIGLDIFKNRIFSSSLAAMTALFVSIAGVLVLVPFYLQHIQGEEPMQVGLYMMIIPMLMFLVAPLAGRLSDRIGYPSLTMFGVLANSTGLYMLSRFDINTAPEYIIASLAVIGVGVGTFNTPNSSAMMGSIRDDQRAIASGILPTSRNVGIAIGIATVTALFTFFRGQVIDIMTEPQAFVFSYQNVTLVSMAVALVGLPLCVIRGWGSKTTLPDRSQVL